MGCNTLLRALSSASTKRRSFALVGGPRMGKTSILKQLITQSRTQWQRRPQEFKVVPIYIDLHLLLKGGWRTFAQQLWKCIIDGVMDPRLHGDASLPKRPRPDFRKVKHPWDLLGQSLNAFWSQLGGTAAWCEYILIFDQADLFLHRNFDGVTDFMAELFRGQEPWRPQAIIAAGGRSFREALLDSSFGLSSLRVLSLAPLNMSDTQRLIRRGFDESSMDFHKSLMAASGRHPYVMQRILAEYETHGSAISIEEAVDRAAGDCLALFDAIWEQFDLGRGISYRGVYAAPEHALMRLLIDSSASWSIQDAERELGIHPLKEYAEFLEYIGVIEKNITGNTVNYSAHFELFNLWYSERLLR
jgi:hypothetical protein